MTQKALVIYADENIVELTIKRECACSGKDTCQKSCFSLANDTINIKLENKIGAKQGDIVEIEGASPVILLYSFCVFVVPIVCAALIFFLLSLTTKNLFVLYGVTALCFVVAFVLLAAGMNKAAVKKNNFRIIRISNCKK